MRTEIIYNRSHILIVKRVGVFTAGVEGSENNDEYNMIDLIKIFLPN